MNELVRDLAPETDLIVIVPDAKDALAVFSEKDATGVDPLLKHVRDKVNAFLTLGHDVSTAAGRDAIRSFAHKVVRSKTALEKVGKALADDVKLIPKKVDASRKKLSDTLDAWRDEVRQPLTEWEAAEDARVQKHKDAIARIEQLALPLDEAAAAMRAKLAEIEAISVGPSCDEFVTEYAIAKDRSIGLIKATLAKREKFEADQAELARLRTKEREREAEEGRERLRKEGEERARLEAEADARLEKERAEHKLADEKAAAEKRERDLIAAKEAAERRAVEAAAKAKKDLEDQKAAEAAETAKREADKAHKAKINRAALAALVEGGLHEETARLAIKLIASGAVPSVKIYY